MPVPVKLSSDALISYWTFCKAIAQALCPTNESYFDGIECIIGKTITRHTAVASTPGNGRELFPVGLQRVLISEDGATLDQLISDDYQGGEHLPLELSLVNSSNMEVVEVSFQFQLTEEDRRSLKDLLPRLPSLRYPLSDEETAGFLDAYFRLRDRPEWNPVLVDARYIEQQKEKQTALNERHKAALQEEFSAGRLMAVDAQHVPVAVLGASSFIPRSQAIAYLERCGLQWDGNALAANIQGVNLIAEPPSLQAAQQEMQISGKRGASDKLSGFEAVASGAGNELHAVDVRLPALSRQAVVPAAIQSVGKVARIKRVEELTGLKRSSIYNRMDERSAQYDPTFPRSFALGAQPGSGVGWDEDKVKAWVAARAASGSV